MKTLVNIRNITLLLFFCGIFPVQAQLDRAAAEAYLADMRAHKEAIRAIHVHKEIQKGIDILTTLILRSEQKTNYPKENLAAYYKSRTYGWFYSGDIEKALQDCKQALVLFNQAGKAGEADKSIVWYLLAELYGRTDNWQAAMQAADSCVQTAESYYGPFHSTTIMAYSQRSCVAINCKMKGCALNDRKKILEIIQRNVERNFVYLTTTERSAYWEENRGETTDMFAFAHKLNEWESDFTDALYNQQLLAKSILLTTETSLQRAIDGDNALQKVYQQIRALTRKANDPKAIPSDAETALLEASHLERSLGESANSIHQFTNVLKVRTDDVRAKLGRQDIAVELVDYRIGKDSTMYAALVLSPNLEHVCFIPLFEERELPQLADQTFLRLWQPILQAVGKTKVSNIYFSPTGKLHQQPIESAKTDDGQYMSDKFNLYRLSSTRWLVNAGNQTSGKNAVIYGGLTYNTSIEEMKQDAEQYPRKRGTSARSSTLRGLVAGLPNLPATKTEAESIARIINQTADTTLRAETYMGSKGTEAAFKDLDGKHTRIIHLATHGEYAEAVVQGEDDAESALQRSVLFFAGAQNKYLGDTIPQEVEDGILTAQEVAMLDLSGLEVAVLSACQTAQGQLGSDGIFGLQRGFKKAGAQSLLISLWKVDDEATCMLMTTFYENWITHGMSKHEAFEKAKQTVRSHTEKGWQNPEYWAAFILIDAI